MRAREPSEVEPRPECQISGLVSICSNRARKTWNDTTALECRGILRQSAKSTDRGFIERERRGVSVIGTHKALTRP